MIPRCRRCGETVSVSVGLPVFVSFSSVDDDGFVATVGVDTDELDDEYSVNCACETGEPDLTDGQADALCAALGAVGKRCAPECDIDISAANVADDAAERAAWLASIRTTKET